MNRWIGMGRLTADPNVTYTSGNEPMAVARFNLAIDRPKKDAGADFIPCVCFGKTAESAEKMLKKGTKICVEGRIQTGSYTNKEGAKIYTTDAILDRFEFCEKKADGEAPTSTAPAPDSNDFMNIPDGFEEELPFV